VSLCTCDADPGGCDMGLRTWAMDVDQLLMEGPASPRPSPTRLSLQNDLQKGGGREGSASHQAPPLEGQQQQQQQQQQQVATKRESDESEGTSHQRDLGGRSSCCDCTCCCCCTCTCTCAC
jgi:hypothetical protein